MQFFNAFYCTAIAPKSYPVLSNGKNLIIPLHTFYIPNMYIPTYLTYPFNFLFFSIKGVVLVLDEAFHLPFQLSKNMLF